MILSILAAAAETVSGTKGEAVPDVNQVISDIVDKPEIALSKFEQFITDVWNGFLSFIPTLIFAVIVLILGLLASKLCLFLMNKGLARTKVDITVVKFLRSLVKIVLYVLIFTAILTILGVPTTSIIAVIGTAGLAVGLALQGSLSNLAGGFIILITKPFKVGDFIELNGTSGTVEAITIFYTRLDTIDNKAVYIPNGTVINATVSNATENALRRVDLTFTISYDDDYDEAVKAIKDVIGRNDKVITEIPGKEPFVGLLEHGASAIVIAVRPWCSKGDYWEVFFRMQEDIRREFLKKGISIPYNQLDVHVINDNK